MSNRRVVVNDANLVAPLTEVVKEIQKWADPEIVEHMAATPGRVSRAWGEFFGGALYDPFEFVASALEKSPGDQMVVIRGIPFVSVCAHHLEKFVGHAHVAYVPRKHIIGLSKIPRVVDAYSRRPQVQEHLTEQIATCLFQGALKPKGVGVALQAVHHCMLLRGVKKHGETITCALRGCFTQAATKQEFFSWLKLNP